MTSSSEASGNSFVGNTPIKEPQNVLEAIKEKIEDTVFQNKDGDSSSSSSESDFSKNKDEMTELGGNLRGRKFEEAEKVLDRCIIAMPKKIQKNSYRF